MEKIPINAYFVLIIKWTIHSAAKVKRILTFFRRLHRFCYDVDRISLFADALVACVLVD